MVSDTKNSLSNAKLRAVSFCQLNHTECATFTTSSQFAVHAETNYGSIFLNKAFPLRSTIHTRFTSSRPLHTSDIERAPCQMRKPPHAKSSLCPFIQN